MFYDLAGREFTKKPLVEGTLVKVCKGFFDTFNDAELYKDQLAIIINVERFMEDDNRGSYNLMPMYDLVYIDKDGNILNTEYRVKYNVVHKAGLRLKSSKYNHLNLMIEKINNKITKSF